MSSPPKKTTLFPAALLLAASSAFIGFFSWRLNHPAFFSVCYAPWILYSWLRILDALRIDVANLVERRGAQRLRVDSRV